MSWVATGIVGGGLLNMGGSILGGKKQAKSAKKAAKYQLIAQREAAQRLEPWRKRGDVASQEIQTLMGLQGGDADSDQYGAFSKFNFEKDPGYDFRMQEGMKGVENSAAARGMQLSGAAMKALNRYNQGFASNEYGNAFNRFQTDRGNRFNMLTDIANKGLGSTNNLNQIGMNTAQQRGNYAIQEGNAKAGMIKGAMNALGGMATGLSGMAHQNQMMDKYLGGGGQSAFKEGTWQNDYQFGFGSDPY